MNIEKLKQKILDLAIRGKLVPQDPNDEPPSVLIEKIRAEKERLVKEGKIKATKDESYIYKGSDNCYYEKKGNVIKNINDEIPFNIPDNWCWVRLKSISDVRNGFTPRRDNKDYWDNGTIPWFTIDDKHEQGMYINHTKQHITEIALTKNRIVPANSVLLCCTASVGEVAYTNIPLTTNQQFNGLTIKSDYIDCINPHYLLVFARTLEQTLNNKLATATTFGFVSVSKVESLLIPIPPVKEQNIIAKLIENIDVLLNNIEANYKDIKECVSFAKQKILDSVFNKNSSYKSYYKNRIKTTLSELIPKDKIGDGDWVLSENMDTNGEYSLVQLKHIGQGVYLNKSFCHVNKDFFISNSCTEIKENYILINRLIADNMNVCLLPHLDFKCITAVDVCWIAPSDQYNQKYLLYYLLSPTFQKQVQLKTSGTTRKRISKNNLIKLDLYVHDIKYQDIIVEEIDKMFNILDSIIS